MFPEAWHILETQIFAEDLVVEGRSSPGFVNSLALNPETGGQSVILLIDLTLGCEVLSEAGISSGQTLSPTSFRRHAFDSAT